MFKHIMFPVDLHLPPEVRKAAEIAAQVARWQGARITIVSVTSNQPGDPAQTETAIKDHLSDLADELSQAMVSSISVPAGTLLPPCGYS